MLPSILVDFLGDLWMLFIHDVMEVFDLLFICGVDVNVFYISSVLIAIFA